MMKDRWCTVVTKAKALFPFEGGDSDQLPFLEGDILNIVDHSDEDWWKTEKAGVIFLVPASYLEIVGESTHIPFLKWYNYLVLIFCL